MIILGEQTNPGVQLSGQQALYVKSVANAAPGGALARVTSSGVEAVVFDSTTYSAAVGAQMQQINFGGV
jgi:hypothetical protein